MLVLSGALAEMAWSVILSKRETFRYIYIVTIYYITPCMSQMFVTFDFLYL
jgi:hypothetical protein